MGDRLNDLTAAELAEIRSEGRKELRHCLMCDKSHLMRKDQTFCSAGCRAKYAAAAARLAYEKLCREKEAWTAERSALVQEVAELRKALECVQITVT